MSLPTEESSSDDVREWLETKFKGDFYKDARDGLIDCDGQNLLNLSKQDFIDLCGPRGSVVYNALHLPQEEQKIKEDLLFIPKSYEDFDLELSLEKIWNNEIIEYINFIESLHPVAKRIPFSILRSAIEPLFFDYHDPKMLKNYKKELYGTITPNPQTCTISALFQYSGAGKTKTCYSLAQRQAGVIIRKIFVNDEHLDPFKSLFTDALSRVDKFSLSQYFEYSLKIVELYILCHIECYLKFINYGETHYKDKLKDDMIYDIALRYFQDGGFEIITQYFNKCVIDMQKGDLNFEIYRRNIKKEALHRHLFLCFDEVIVTKGYLTGHFMHANFDPYNEEHVRLQGSEIKNNVIIINGNEYRKTDLLYAFTRVSEFFVSSGIPVVFISTHFSAFSAITSEPESYSRKNMRFSKYINLPMFYVEDMIAILKQLNISLLNEEYLKPFEGRPLFFSILLHEILKKLLDKFQDNKLNVNKPFTRNELKDLAIYSESLVKGLINEKYIKSKKGNINRVLYYLHLHAGMIFFNSTDEENEVNMGIARVIHYYIDKNRIRSKITEPIVVNSLNNLIESSNILSPDEDHVFKYLNSVCGPTSAEGKISEYIIARLITREKLKIINKWIEMNRLKSSLSDDTQFSPSICGTEEEFELKEMNMSRYFNECRLLFPKVHLGPDITTLIKTKKLGDIPVSIQIKNYEEPLNKSQTISCINSLDPSLFYESASDKREKFLSIWDESHDFFDNYIRIIISFSGFNKESIDMISAYNSANETQPILLVGDIDEKDIGKELKGNKTLFKMVENKNIGKISYTQKISFDNFSIKNFKEYSIKIRKT